MAIYYIEIKLSEEGRWSTFEINETLEEALLIITKARVRFPTRQYRLVSEAGDILFV